MFSDDTWLETLGPQPTVASVTNLVAASGGGLIAAHPYDRSAGPSFADGIFAMTSLDAIQVSNAGLASERNHIAVDAAIRMKVSAVGGSGTGREGPVGRAATVLLHAPRDQADLVDILRKGDVWVVEMLDEVPAEEPEAPRDRGDDRRGDRGGRGGDRGGRGGGRGGPRHGDRGGSRGPGAGGPRREGQP